MSDTPIVEVLVADDHELVRGAIAAHLAATGRMHCVAEAGTGADAVDLVIEHRPHVAVVDVGLPDIDGFEVARRIDASGAGTRVVLFSSRISSTLVQDGFDAGAWAYLSKVSSVELLPEAIDAVLAGTRYVDPEVAADLAPAVHEVLDADELTVLEHMAAGRDDAAISKLMSVGVDVVQSHVAAILAALGCATRKAAVSHAILQGMAE